MAKTGFLKNMQPADMPVEKRGANWERAAAEMKRLPWEPYVVSRNVSRSIGTRIRRGGMKAFRPPQDWRVACKGSGHRAALVMMYVGTPQPPDYQEHPIWKHTWGWKEDDDATEANTGRSADS